MNDTSDETPPPIPTEILEKLLLDAKNLAFLANEVKSVVCDDEKREAARQDFIQLNELLERCLECVINLMDLQHPTLPRFNVNDGYQFQSGDMGFRVFKPLLVPGENK